MKLANPVFTFPLRGRWEEFFAELTDRRERNWLRRFFGFCSEREIEPEELSDKVVSSFFDGVEAAGVSRPSQVVRDAIKAWNKLSKIHPKWPKIELTLRDRRPSPSLMVEDLPKSFQRSLEAFLTKGPDGIFDAPRRPITSEKTLKDKSLKIYQLATHAVASGLKPERLQSIHDLITFQTTTNILERLWTLSDRKPNNHFYNLTRQLRYIAQSAEKPDQSIISRIKQAEARLREKHKGITLKARQRLRPFVDPTILSRLINLGAQIKERAERHKLNLTDAFALQSALAVDLLLCTPVQIKYIAALDYKENIRRMDYGQRIIDLSNNFKQPHKVSLFPLPASTEALLELYKSSYMTLFGKSPDQSLFISRHGRQKPPSALSAQINTFVQRELGLDVTPCDFRHLAALIYLRNNPGDYETVRQFLGHASVQTTKEFYQHFAEALAFEDYDALINMTSVVETNNGDQ